MQQRSDAEVPIPVLAEVEDAEAPPTALGSVTNTPSRPPLPTISITKPPAPLPVSLPTPFDLETLPSRPLSSFDTDLEAGHSSSMREISREKEKTSIPPLRSPQSFAGHENAAMGLASPLSIPLPTSPASIPPLDLTSLPLAPAAINIHDFLADSDPMLETTPIQPTSPVVAGNPPQLPLAEQKLLDEPEDNPQGTLGDDLEDDTYPNEGVTIRLVGGGGTAGTTAALPNDDINVNGEAEPDIDVAGTSVVSVPRKEPNVNMAGKKPEQKKGGMSGLRKLGHLSGLRKNESSSSLKDMV